MIQMDSEANCLNPLNAFPYIHLEIVITAVPRGTLFPFQMVPVLGFLALDLRTALLPPVPTRDSSPLSYFPDEYVYTYV